MNFYHSLMQQIQQEFHKINMSNLIKKINETAMAYTCRCIFFFTEKLKENLIYDRIICKLKRLENWKIFSELR